jgi:hypothetical protein
MLIMLSNKQTTQGEKLKKKTLKDFKENKKIIDDDKNILYNVYLKYKSGL